jgi:hypothetical protein
LLTPVAPSGTQKEPGLTVAACCVTVGAGAAVVVGAAAVVGGGGAVAVVVGAAGGGALVVGAALVVGTGGGVLETVGARADVPGAGGGVVADPLESGRATIATTRAIARIPLIDAQTPMRSRNGSRRGPS